MSLPMYVLNGYAAGNPVAPGILNQPPKVGRDKNRDMMYNHLWPNFDGHPKPTTPVQAYGMPKAKILTDAEWQRLENEKQLPDYEIMDNFRAIQPKNSFIIGGHGSNRALYGQQYFDQSPTSSENIYKKIKDTFKSRIDKAKYILILACNVGNEKDPPCDEKNNPRSQDAPLGNRINSFAREICQLFDKPTCGAEGFVNTVEGNRANPVITSRINMGGERRSWRMFYPMNSPEALSIPAYGITPNSSIFLNWFTSLINQKGGCLPEIIKKAAETEYLDFIKRNATTADVQRLLKFLSDYGWSIGEVDIDARFGNHTREAIRRFQIESNKRFQTKLETNGVWNNSNWLAGRSAVFDITG
ncbi:MAG: peptidoglycan-binding protein [Fibrobacteres bacterium]|nr:peptidoglycan-binding protein [Fibrobacterota bacterium]